MAGGESNHPFQELLRTQRALWFLPDTPAHVLSNYSKVMDCGTLALGGERFASENESKIVPHTCKSRYCPRCGVRSNDQWCREIDASLPNIQYVNINLTMPSLLWPHLQEHPALFHDLCSIGAHAIMHWAHHRYGVRLLVMVIPQPFGGKLTFHPHLHVLVSGGGLHEASNSWFPWIRFDMKELMQVWRFAVIAYFGRLAHVIAKDPIQFKISLKILLRRPWNVFVSHRMSKSRFIRYAGRYLRRPPIAESRLSIVSESQVLYIGKDTRAKKPVTLMLSSKDFLRTMAQHVPQHYSHGVRYFGLLAPLAKRRTNAQLFALLRQTRRPKPPRLSWAFSVLIRFGSDPLVDRYGQQMKWIANVKPEKSAVVARGARA